MTSANIEHQKNFGRVQCGENHELAQRFATPSVTKVEVELIATHLIHWDASFHPKSFCLLSRELNKRQSRVGRIDRMSDQTMSSSDSQRSGTANFQASLSQLPRNLLFLFLGAAVVNSAFPEAKPWVTLAVFVIILRGLIQFATSKSSPMAKFRDQLFQDQLSQSDPIDDAGRLADRSLREMLSDAQRLMENGNPSPQRIDWDHDQLEAAKNRTRLEAEAMRKRVLAKKKFAPQKKSQEAESVKLQKLASSEQNRGAQRTPPGPLLRQKTVREPITGRERQQRGKRKSARQASDLDSKVF